MPLTIRAHNMELKQNSGNNLVPIFFFTNVVLMHDFLPLMLFVSLNVSQKFIRTFKLYIFIFLFG